MSLNLEFSPTHSAILPFYLFLGRAILAFRMVSHGADARFNVCPFMIMWGRNQGSQRDVLHSSVFALFTHSVAPSQCSI